MIDLQRPRLDELRRAIVKGIPCEPEGVRSDLEALALPSLLIHYINWCDRLINPRPRKVFTWDGFLKHGNATSHLAAVQRLQQKIEAGADLRPFLSDQPRRYGYVRPKIGKGGKRRGVEWRDKDYALNAYDVHHLHLGEGTVLDGRIQHTRELLYASFARDRAFLVMVGDHKSFDDGTLTQAIAEARVASGDIIKGVIGTERQFSPEERRHLQRSGISTFAQVGNQVVQSGMLSTAGTSILHTMHAQKIMRLINIYELALDDEATGREWFEIAKQPYPAKADYEWVLWHCDLAVFERMSGLMFSLLHWRR